MQPESDPTKPWHCHSVEVCGPAQWHIPQEEKWSLCEFLLSQCDMEHTTDCWLLHSQDNSISKLHIHAALNVGEMWLRQPEEGHQLVQLYGEGGVCKACEVKDEIVRRCEPPLGSRAPQVPPQLGDLPSSLTTVFSLLYLYLVYLVCGHHA